MITEIVDVLQNIAKNFQNNTSQEIVYKNFIQTNKYDENLVATAYSWFYEREKKKSTKLSKKRLIRFFNEFEKEVLGKEVSGYLTKLNSIGLLNAVEVDNIVEKLLDLPEDRINIESINVLLLSLYLDPEENSLPGSRSHLFFYDKIN